MKKITKTQAASKKPMVVKIESSGDKKKKYERKDFRNQLREFKKKMQKPAANQTTKVEIKTDSFEYTKASPLKVDGWLIWRGVNDNLVVMPENRRQNERYYQFEFADGFVFLVNKPKARYAYFHTVKFQEFLERYGIHRVQYKDPNGEYQGRNDVYQNTVSIFRFATDGEWVESESSQLRMGQDPVVAMNKATTFINVSDASFVVFEQIAYRRDDADIEPFILRQVVTDYDIFSIEPEIAEACKYLDQAGSVEEETAATMEKTEEVSASE